MFKYVIQDLYGILKMVPYGVIIGCLLYIVILLCNKRNADGNKRKYSLGEFLFCVYAAVVIVITFLSREAGTGGKLDLQIGSSLGINVRNNAYVVENILLFLPYGFLLGVVWKKGRGFLNHLSAGFLTSLFIEVLQLVSGRGIFQADDIITNTVGSIIGYIIYYLLIGIRKRKDA